MLSAGLGGALVLCWCFGGGRREISMLVNPADIIDGEIVNAAWAVAGMVVKPRRGKRTAVDLDTAAFADTGRLIREA
jgi:hypothetical protein